MKTKREPAPDKPKDPPPPAPTDYKLPDWLAQYMDWSGTTGNQTPMIFHQAAGLWLLATAVGRRLYGEAPWGVKIYPNLYLMLVAGTTFYRKSTAYKLAEQVARQAIPHMLMPTPASLSCAVSTGDWDNGLLIRFALLSPEPNYAERPAAKQYRTVPQPLIDDLKALHDRLPAPQQSEMGMKAPGSLRLNVQCWEQVQHYGDWLRRRCDPGRDTELDDRLKGVYGRMHVQAFKLASLFAALDWLKTNDDVPTVTVDHWQAAHALAEGWRGSTHRLLEQLDRSGEAVQEKRHQDRLLNTIRQAGGAGVALRDLYRNLNFSAKQARQLAQDLIRADLIEERRIERAEAYIATEFLVDA